MSTFQDNISSPYSIATNRLDSWAIMRPVVQSHLIGSTEIKLIDVVNTDQKLVVTPWSLDINNLDIKKYQRSITLSRKNGTLKPIEKDQCKHNPLLDMITINDPKYSGKYYAELYFSTISRDLSFDIGLSDSCVHIYSNVFKGSDGIETSSDFFKSMFDMIVNVHRDIIKHDHFSGLAGKYGSK